MAVESARHKTRKHTQVVDGTSLVPLTRQKRDLHGSDLVGHFLVIIREILGRQSKINNFNVRRLLGRCRKHDILQFHCQQRKREVGTMYTHPHTSSR